MKDIKTSDLISEFFKLETKFEKLEGKYTKLADDIDKNQEKILEIIKKRKDLTINQKAKLKNEGIEL